MEKFFWLIWNNEWVWNANKDLWTTEKKVSEMKPVVANASEIFENLIAKFKASDTDKKFKSKQIKFSANFNAYSIPKIQSSLKI